MCDTMHARSIVLMLGIILIASHRADGAGRPDLALCISVENPVQRPGAFCVLHLRSPSGDTLEDHLIQRGDVLEYDVLLGPAAPTRGVMELRFDDFKWLTELLAVHAPQIAAESQRVWTKAVGHWQHARIPLDAVAGSRIQGCYVRLAGDAAGLYQVALDNIEISNAGCTQSSFYDNQPSMAVGLWEANGFRMPHPIIFDKSLIREDASLPAMMQRLYETSLELPRLTAALAGMKLLAEDYQATGQPTNFPAIYNQCRKYGHVKLLRQLRAREFGAELDDLVAAAEPLRSQAKRYTVHAVAYAHLDFVWLWGWEETLRTARDTFRQMLTFMDEFPQFTFSYTSPALFEALEREDPALFARIQRRAREDRWEMIGSRWCEADPNLIGEESDARHFLEAQRYNLEKFGTQTEVCYEPDIFGHLPTMPQLLRKSGLRYYLAQHMPNAPPVFWWDGPDGSRVLCYRPHHYADTLDENLLDFCLTQPQRTAGYTDALIVYGAGNHGGGPTHDQIENGLRLDKLPMFPAVKFSTLQNFMNAISRESPIQQLPVVKGDINLDYRGTYTTHAETKRLNRACENTLTVAESFDAIAQVLGIQPSTNRFGALWRALLWAHHHDTISGTTVHGSDLYAQGQLRTVLSNATTALQFSLSNIVAVTETVGPSPHPCVVFNAVAWPVTAPVRLPLPDASNRWEWVEAGGHTEPVQQVLDSNGAPCGMAVLHALPGLGYRVGWLRPRMTPVPDGPLKRTGSLAARNEYVQLEVSPRSGSITRLADLTSTTEWVRADAPAARLRVDYEAPHDWSAWEIGPVVRTDWLDAPKSVECVEEGPVRIVFRARYEFGHSTIIKDIILNRDLSRVDVEVHVDWQESASPTTPAPWLRIEFPTAVSPTRPVWLIPFGEIERPADGSDYPASYGMGLGSAHGSICLVSDAKNGFSATNNTLRVSLLRSSYVPDPAPDVGEHHIALALEISPQPWPQAAMSRRGIEFNRRPIALGTGQHVGRLPAERSFLAVEPSAVVLTVLKTAYDAPSNLVVRIYQAAETSARARISSSLPLTSWVETDLIERSATNAPSVNPNEIPLEAWEIETYQVGFRRK